MDDGVRRHAAVLVEHSVEAEAGDDVLIRAPTPAEDLVVALYERLGEVGATPETLWANRRADTAHLTAADPGDVTTPEHRRAAMAAADAVILVKGQRNHAEGAPVDAETGRAYGEAKQPVVEARLDARWVITPYPTAAAAQRAGMSTADYRSFVHDAVDRDWTALRRRQERVADRLRAGDRVRVVAGDTDLRLRVDGMGAYNDDGTENMPGGEVATCPVVDSVEGTLAVDGPLRRGGREVEGARLTFEDGTVVDHAAERNEAVLARLLDRDAGARRAGEFGIGTNRGVDRYTGDVLFDEKRGGTVHLALGRAMEECVPEDRQFNDSDVHADLVVDVAEDARVTVDGETVLRDGALWFEDDFEA